MSKEQISLNIEGVKIQVFTPQLYPMLSALPDRGQISEEILGGLVFCFPPQCLLLDSFWWPSCTGSARTPLFWMPPTDAYVGAYRVCSSSVSSDSAGSYTHRLSAPQLGHGQPFGKRWGLESHWSALETRMTPGCNVSLSPWGGGYSCEE